MKHTESTANVCHSPLSVRLNSAMQTALITVAPCNQQANRMLETKEDLKGKKTYLKHC